MATAASGFRRVGRKTRRKIVLLAILLLLLALMSYLVYYFTLNKSLPNLGSAPRPAAQVIDPPQYLFSISGTGVNSIGRPIGVAIGKDGRVYVSDATRSRVLVFTRDGKYLSSFFAINDGRRKRLVTPVHMAFNNDKAELYVADRALDALYVFDTEGRFLRTFPKPASVKRWSPLAIAFGADGRIYLSDVGDSNKHRIVVFDPAGKELLSWGTTARVDQAAQRTGAFYFPNGIAVRSDGTIYVVDGDNRRLQIFDRDGKYLDLVDTVGIPRGIWLDEPKKRLIVSDALANQVDIFSLKGEKLVSFGEGGSGPGQFKFPNDVALDSEGRIYVADRENHQVQVWGWPQAQVPPVVAGLVQRWYWCLSPLLLLPLLLLRRRREIVVMPDFVDSLIGGSGLAEMERPRLRWVASGGVHAASFAGRVEDGIDLGELIEPVEHSESDAKELAETLECDLPTAVILAIAKRSGRLAAQSEELRHLATLLEIDVFDAQEYVQRMQKAKR
ncbi:MAG TPA: 6-bladed beta-propeller [Coriobacteriia bacterium]|jgi:DNA-binding beta-propeller fold protein YncE